MHDFVLIKLKFARFVRTKCLFTNYSNGHTK